MKSSFSKKFRGYRPNEVDNYIIKLTAEQEKIIAALEAGYSELKQENERVKAQVASLQAELDKYQEAKNAVAEAFIQAQLKASAIEEDARRRAGEIEKTALAEVSARKMELNNLRLQHAKAQEEFKHILEKYRRIIDEQVFMEPVEVERMPKVQETKPQEESKGFFDQKEEFEQDDNDLPLGFLEPDN